MGGARGGGARSHGAEYGDSDGYDGYDGYDASLRLSRGVLECTVPPAALVNASSVRVSLALNGVDFVELHGAPSHTLRLYDAPTVCAAAPQSGVTDGGTPLRLGGAGLDVAAHGAATCRFGANRTTAASVDVGGGRAAVRDAVVARDVRPRRRA